MIYDAIQAGIPLSRIHEITKIDMWFLRQYEELYALDVEISKHDKESLPKDLLLEAKQKGFADRQIAHMLDCLESEVYNKGQKLTTYDSTERYPRSVQIFASDKQKSKLHPTQKPLSLIEYMIRTYTNEGDLILDNTCGSGTTGLGAKNLGRNFIMMEQDPEHYETACKRVIT